MGNAGAESPRSTATIETRGEATPIADAPAVGPVSGLRRLAERLQRADRADRLAMAVVLAPLVVAAIVLLVVVRGRYLPYSDNALIEMQVRDVGRHPVLVGLYSRFDWGHPGPMLFYLLAPFYWLTGGSSIGMNLGTLAINGASIAGMAVIARHRGGTPLLLCTLLACTLLMRTLSAEFLRDPWNCFVTTLPFGLMLFLTWALMCGEAWALPVATIVASFLAQTHVGFVILALPLLAWGAAALVASWPRDRWTELRRPVSASAAWGGVLWLPVALEVVTSGSDNNLRAMVRYFRHTEEPTHGLGEAWRVVTAQYSLVPEWLSTKQPLSWGGQSPFLSRSPLPWLLGLVVLAAVGLWRSRQSDARRLIVLLCVTFVLSIVAVVRTVGLASDYRLRWTWIPPMMAVALVSWAGWQVVSRHWPAFARRVLVPAAVIALVLVSGVNVYTAATAGVPVAEASAILDELTPEVVAALDETGDEGQVIVHDPFSQAAGIARGLVLQLERRGIDARVEPERRLLYGDHRVVDDGPVLARLIVGRDSGVTALEGSPDLERVADWQHSGRLPVPEAVRHVEELYTALSEGEIDEAEFEAAMEELDLPPLPPVSYQVAVFLDVEPG